MQSMVYIVGTGLQTIQVEVYDSDNIIFMWTTFLFIIIHFNTFIV